MEIFLRNIFQNLFPGKFSTLFSSYTTLFYVSYNPLLALKSSIRGAFSPVLTDFITTNHDF